MAVSTLEVLSQDKESGTAQDYLDALGVAAEKLLAERYSADSLRREIAASVFEKGVNEPVLETISFARLRNLVARSHPHLMRRTEDLKAMISFYRVHHAAARTPCYLYFHVRDNTVLSSNELELRLRRITEPADTARTPNAGSAALQVDYISALELAAKSLTARAMTEMEPPVRGNQVVDLVQLEELAGFLARSHPHLPRAPSDIANGMAAHRAHHIAKATPYYPYFRLRPEHTIMDPGTTVELFLYSSPAASGDGLAPMNGTTA